MSDDYGLAMSGVDPESFAELRRLRREEAIADAMYKQGMTPLQGGMVGNVYVRPSITQGLAQLANSYFAGERERKITADYKALGEKRKAVEDAVFESFKNKYYGTPERTETMHFDDSGVGSGMDVKTPAVIPTMDSKQQAIIELLKANTPAAKQAAQTYQQDLSRAREMKEFQEAIRGSMTQGAPEQLTGFEPMSKGVPGQQGMVGDPQQLIQQIAMNPDMSNEDKQAAIAQIREQAAGAQRQGSKIDPYALLMTGDPKALPVATAVIGQQEQAERQKERLAQQAKHDEMMARLRESNEPPPVSVVKRGVDGKDDPKLGTELISRKQAIEEKRTLAGNDPTIQGGIAAAKSEGREVGEGAGKAKLNLPGAQKAKDAAFQQVDELLEHPGFESYVGWTWRPFASRFHGTKEADFEARLKQIEGVAFLDAYTMLKGGGAITEIEGTKATIAKNRMKNATSEAEFKLAAKDYKDALTRGFDLLEKQSQMGMNKTGGAYDDPDKERRYQEYKRSQGL